MEGDANSGSHGSHYPGAKRAPAARRAALAVSAVASWKTRTALRRGVRGVVREKGMADNPLLKKYGHVPQLHQIGFDLSMQEVHELLGLFKP